MRTIYPTLCGLSLWPLVVVLLFGRLSRASLDPIVIKGSRFFYKTNGTEFFIRGITYQQDSTSANYADPLADAEGCRRDIPYLEQLGINVVHVYAIDSSYNHTACMSLLEEAGIYVLAGLAHPGETIDSKYPGWGTELYDSYTATIDVMANFTNTLGFFAGNAITTHAGNSAAASFVKASVRDMKKYISRMGYRSIGVGYATNDTLVADSDYYNCGDAASSIDFYGINVYSWCGDSTATVAGYTTLTNTFANWSIPVFFAEYGCINVQPRVFSEVQAIYGPEMAHVFSGGIVKAYFENGDSFGLVKVSKMSVSTKSDFNAFSTQLALVTPSATAASNYKVTNTLAQSCPSVGATWMASPTLPPTPNNALCDCMVSSLSCVASSVVNGSMYGTLLSSICGTDPSACLGIASNSTTGTYGAYSVCNYTEKTSWVMNHYHLSQNQSSSSCNFDGLAKLQMKANSSTECTAFFSQAGKEGTGTVTDLPAISSVRTPTKTGTSTTATDTTGFGYSGPYYNYDTDPYLGPGAKAGIAVGCIAIIGLLATGILFCLRRKRRGRDREGKVEERSVDEGVELGGAVGKGIDRDRGMDMDMGTGKGKGTTRITEMSLHPNPFGSGSSSLPPHHPYAHPSSANTTSLLDLQAEEQRIDAAIAEAERIQALRNEKDKVKKLMLGLREKGSEGEEKSLGSESSASIKCKTVDEGSLKFRGMPGMR